MKKVLAGLAAGALAMGIFASTSFAAVQFDSSTGTGFVGKGDVQQALGLNNAQLQEAVAKKELSFTYVAVDTYEITVEWTTGEGTKGEKTHTVEHKKEASVSAGVNSDARKSNQYTGFNLKGLTNVVSEEVELPEIGDIYPGNSGHEVKNVKLVSSTSTLYVNGVPLQ